MHCLWIVLWNSSVRTGYTSWDLFLDKGQYFANEPQKIHFDLNSNCSFFDRRDLSGSSLEPTMFLLLLCWGRVKVLRQWTWTMSPGLTSTLQLLKPFASTMLLQPLFPSRTAGSSSSMLLLQIGQVSVSICKQKYNLYPSATTVIRSKRNLRISNWMNREILLGLVLVWRISRSL